jgi:hypothetical protein
MRLIIRFIRFLRESWRLGRSVRLLMLMVVLSYALFGAVIWRIIGDYLTGEMVSGTVIAHKYSPPHDSSTSLPVITPGMAVTMIPLEDWEKARYWLEIDGITDRGNKSKGTVVVDPMTWVTLRNGDHWTRDIQIERK